MIRSDRMLHSVSRTFRGARCAYGVSQVLSYEHWFGFWMMDGGDGFMDGFVLLVEASPTLPLVDTSLMCPDNKIHRVIILYLNGFVWTDVFNFDHLLWSICIVDQMMMFTTFKDPGTILQDSQDVISRSSGFVPV